MLREAYTKELDVLPICIIGRRQKQPLAGNKNVQKYRP